MSSKGTRLKLQSFTFGYEHNSIAQRFEDKLRVEAEKLGFRIEFSRRSLSDGITLTYELYGKNPRNGLTRILNDVKVIGQESRLKKFNNASAEIISNFQDDIADKNPSPLANGARVIASAPEEIEIQSEVEVGKIVPIRTASTPEELEKAAAKYQPRLSIEERPIDTPRVETKGGSSTERYNPELAEEVLAAKKAGTKPTPSEEPKLLAAAKASRFGMPGDEYARLNTEISGLREEGKARAAQAKENAAASSDGKNRLG